MAVTNQITPRKNSTQILEYEANGEKVKLSPQTVRNYLVSGGGNVSDQEVVMFLNLCKYQHLNPFLREAYLIKYGNSPATIVTGKDVFIKRAKRNPAFMGKQSGIIVQTENGETIEREGTFHLQEEKIVGGWAKVFVRGYEHPEYASVAFDEYAGRKSNGELNSQWASKPATMIKKVALVQALRETFPEDFNGLYVQEEKPETSEIVLDETIISEPAQLQQEVQPVQQIQQEPVQTADNVQAALFGDNF
ncbi:MAG: phage recombination protein Bet [Lachnospiraceae bacterium]|jgi:phage recombination protein Bet|nr:phage recombination protein Bet [Lachnospiraceae bacterium]